MVSAELTKNLQDPTLVRVRLRSDVRCTLQHTNGSPYYQLEDPLNARFYRLGLREWNLVKMLDGKQFLREVLMRHGNEQAEETLSSKEAVMLVRWLAQVQLVTFDGDVTHPLYDIKKPQTSALKSISNPLFIRIPLFNPDKLLERCLPWLAWTLSPIAFCVWLTLCLLSLATVFGQWDRFRSSISGILSPHNWLWLLLSWVLLKAIHEFYHGLICKKYGGQVPRCGLVLILFSPIAFVDVTSSWRFRSKWHRIFTAAGGMYIEFFVASLAVLVWARTEQPLVAQICQNVITMASVSALLCNANFLMRFDGYYILTDLLGIQNLYTTGQQYLRYFSRKYLLGIELSNPLDRTARPRFIRAYAFAALIWRWFFYAGILLAASIMFKGAGVVLAILAAMLWLIVPGFKFVRYLVIGTPNEHPNLVRFGIVMCALGLLIATVLYLPWPGGVSAAGVVEYDPLTVHRIDSPGFVQQVHVEAGEYVKPGQLLATLASPETTLELAEIELEIEESRIRSRILHGDEDVVSYQVESKKRESLQRQRDELEQRVQNLTVIANTAGRVIGRDLQSLVGQYLNTGATLLTIGDEDRKHIRLSVAQKDVDFFLKQMNRHPFIRIKGRSQPISNGTLNRIDPRATRKLPDPALAAPNGGPLTVALHNSEQHAEADGDFELVEPHFVASVDIPIIQARGLRAGELAKARICAVGDTIGGHLLGVVQRWVRSRLEPSRR